MIEIYENRQAIGKPGAIDHIAIDVSDIQGVYNIVTQMGYSAIEDGVQSLPFWRNGVKYFTILRLNAGKVEFSERL